MSAPGKWETGMSPMLSSQLKVGHIMWTPFQKWGVIGRIVYRWNGRQTYEVHGRFCGQSALWVGKEFTVTLDVDQSVECFFFYAPE